VPVLTEGFEGTSIPTGWTTIDADNDGYGWEHSSVQESLTGYNSNGSVVSYSYDNDSNEALTPDNWLISPSVSLSGTSSLSFWFVVASSYPGDHYGVYVSTTSATDTSAFTLVYEMTPTSANGYWTQQTIDLTSYAGNTVYIAFRHFNCTDMFLIALDDITVSTMTTDPAIVASPNAVNFGTVYLGDSDVQTVNVISYNSTAPISVLVTAPFSVSTDSITFGTSATLPAAGGTIYVQYEPSAPGLNTAVMTLTAGTLSTTVDLSGSCLDCSPLTLPYTETFETTSPYLGCWLVSGNAAWSIGVGDYSSATGAYEGNTNALITHTSTGNVSKLISPVLGTNNGVVLHFAYVMRSWSGDVDELRVYSRTSENAAWQQIAEYTDAAANWTVANVVVPGSVYQIAFEMTDNYGYGVGIDSVVFEAMAADFCSPVTSLVVTDITSNSATLSWVDAGNTGATYTIYNMADTSVIATVNDTTYTVNNLAANTNYTFGVQAICATSDATITTVSCLTECASETMPWSENFDNWTSKSPCWSFLSGLLSEGAPTAYSSAWTLNSTYGSYITINGKALTMNLYNTLRYWAVTPIINITSNNAMLSVDVAVSAWSAAEPNYDDNDTLAFLVSTDNGATYTLLQALDYTQLNALGNTYTTIFVPVNGYNGQAVRFAIYGGSVSGTSPYDNRIAIDNVSVVEASDCMPVSNLTVSDVTAHGATLTWHGTANSYTIYNMADTSVVQTTTDTTVVISTLNPDTHYTLGVRANCGTDQSLFVTTGFTTLISCPAPTGLAVSLTPGNGTIATLTWTETGSATAWQICVNDDTTNLINVTATTYNFTGLTAEQAYSVKVRAICDVNDMSAWSSPLTFTPTNAYTITVNDGTTTNSYVPIYGLYVDEITKSQFIIPAADLAAMQYGTINKLTFYASQANINWGAATFNVYLTETTDATVTSLADYSSMTQVYAGTLSIVNNIMEVNFTTPYLYMGGNLMVGFLQTVEGTYASSYWYGVSATGASMGGYNTTVSQRNFLPKTKIDYTPGTAPSCLPVTGLTVSNVTDSQVTLTWNGTAASYSVYNGSDFVASTTATTYTFTGLSSATDYVFGVRAVCSATDSSIISNVTASTPCPDVTTLPYNEGFENGLGCWTTINASSDGQPWSVNNCSGLSTVNPHGGAYVASSWSWSGSSMHANAWLISPKFVLPNTTDSLSLSWWEITNGLYPDHYSVVLSTTTSDTAAFTTVLRPYDTAASTWTLQTVDLTPYAGQSVYIAFHHVDYDANFLLVDDISLYQGAYIPPAPDTMTVIFAVNDATMGTTVPAPGTYQYFMGDTVSFHPTANPGYHFTNWVMSVGSQSDTLAANYVSVYFIVNGTFMSYGTVTMTALFEADSTPATTYTVTLATADATMGSVSPAGANTVNAGTSFTATATPADGYHFVAWMSGTTQVSTANPYTFTVNSDITLTATFAENAAEPCETPTNLHASEFDTHSITIGWNTNGNATSWNIHYRVENGEWNNANTNTNTYVISGLVAETTYEIEVQADCGNGNLSDWSTPIHISTAIDGIESWLENSVSLYPNPAKEYIDIRIDGDVNVTMMEVYDVYGKLINTMNVVENPTRINVSGLANGMYFVRVTTEKGAVTKTFVKK